MHVITDIIQNKKNAKQDEENFNKWMCGCLIRIYDCWHAEKKMILFRTFCRRCLWMHFRFCCFFLLMNFVRTSIQCMKFKRFFFLKTFFSPFRCIHFRTKKCNYFCVEKKEKKKTKCFSTDTSSTSCCADADYSSAIDDIEMKL